jgi:hypothetical protein
MEEQTIERKIETKFFKKHRRYMPSVVNLKKPEAPQTNQDDEIARDLASKEE